jgi:hypothetical protein
VAGSPFALNTSSGAPAGISVTGYSATKTYLYAGDTNGNIAAFMVGPAIDNGSTWVLQGNLTPLGGSPYAAGAQPLQLASWGSPQSLTDFVYAADFADPNGGVYAFSVGFPLASGFMWRCTTPIRLRPSRPRGTERSHLFPVLHMRLGTGRRRSSRTEISCTR